MTDRLTHDLSGAVTPPPGPPARRATGHDVARLTAGLAYYRAFNYFKTAGILIGVYARYVAGQKSTEGVDLPMLLGRVTASVDMAWDAGASLRR